MGTDGGSHPSTGRLSTLSIHERRQPTLRDRALLGPLPSSSSCTKIPKIGQRLRPDWAPATAGHLLPPRLPRYLCTLPQPDRSFLPFLQLIKEKLLDLLGKEEDEGSHDENMVRAACGLWVGLLLWLVQATWTQIPGPEREGRVPMARDTLNAPRSKTKP